MRKLMPLLLGIIGIIGGFVIGWAFIFIVYLTMHPSAPGELPWDRANGYGTVSGAVVGLISGTIGAILGSRGIRR